MIITHILGAATVISSGHAVGNAKLRTEFYGAVVCAFITPSVLQVAADRVARVWLPIREAVFVAVPLYMLNMLVFWGVMAVAISILPEYVGAFHYHATVIEVLGYVLSIISCGIIDTAYLGNIIKDPAHRMGIGLGPGAIIGAIIIGVFIICQFLAYGVAVVLAG